MPAPAPHRIDLYVAAPAQLFDSLDPAPFYDKDLDHRAAQYLLECALDAPRERGLAIRVQVGCELAEPGVIATALRQFHVRALASLARQQRARLRLGAQALVVALAVLAACLLGRQVLGEASPWRQALAEGLLILGWVALWRPLEILLYDRLEQAREARALQKLAEAEVDVLAATGSWPA